MPGWLTDVLQWLLDVLLFIPKFLWQLLLEGLALLIEAIPVPDFMDDLDGSFSALDPAILYFTEPMQLGSALGIIITATIIRFVIRRIPLIG